MTEAAASFGELKLRRVVWDYYKEFVPPLVRPRIVRARHSKIWNVVPEHCSNVFIHIPKTGGTTLSALLYGQGINHYPIWVWQAANPARAAKSTFLSVLRDPFDRLVSALRHCQNGNLASESDRAVWAWLEPQCRDLADMAHLYLTRVDVRQALSRNVMFKTFDYWLTPDTGSPRLLVFRLTQAATEGGLRLNAASPLDTLTPGLDALRPLARTVLANEYRWYDRPGAFEIDYVGAVPGLLQRRRGD